MGRISRSIRTRGSKKARPAGDEQADLGSDQRSVSRDTSDPGVETFREMIAKQERLVSELVSATAQQRAVLRELRQQVARRTEVGPDGSVYPDSLVPQTDAPMEGVRWDVVDLEARLFGPFEARYRGRPLAPWRSQRAASLLKYLLLQDGIPARREVLMDAFWPDSSPKSARNNLNVAVYQLRSHLRRLAPDRRYVVFNAGTYRIHHDLKYRTDVKDYSRLVEEGEFAAERGDRRRAVLLFQKARSLYRGPLFEDDLSGEWCSEPQRRLHIEHCTLRDQLCELLLELGDPGEAIAVGEELLEDDPCRETCHQLMMRAYAAMDQRHLVVQQFDRCQKVLRCELALDPMESTVDIYQSLIRDH